MIGPEDDISTSKPSQAHRLELEQPILKPEELQVRCRWQGGVGVGWGGAQRRRCGGRLCAGGW